mmetsp:Transcript_12970/g.50728  ORF Transcript_12970/g.50728 Transcript_12970/m.50728 type:complete len:206 (-) Transcript_12970:2061-2678(-)
MMTATKIYSSTRRSLFLLILMLWTTLHTSTSKVAECLMNAGNAWVLVITDQRASDAMGCMARVWSLMDVEYVVATAPPAELLKRAFCMIVPLQETAGLGWIRPASLFAQKVLINGKIGSLFQMARTAKEEKRLRGSSGSTNLGFQILLIMRKGNAVCSWSPHLLQVCARDANGWSWYMAKKKAHIQLTSSKRARSWSLIALREIR